MKIHVIGFIIVSLIVLGAACQKKTATTNTTVANSNSARNLTETEEVLELANLGGVTFAPHVSGSPTAGDFSMSKTYLDVAAGRVIPMYVFGQPFPGRPTEQLNPNLEFGGLTSAVNVVAAIDGVIGFIKQQGDSKDYEVFLQPSENSSWTIGYDHLTDVTAKIGDRVTAGQILGRAARENNGMYRYELQINKDVNGVTTFHCPTELLRADVQPTQTAAIERFIQDWNAFYGSPVYGSYTSACTKPVLTLDETE